MQRLGARLHLNPERSVFRLISYTVSAFPFRRGTCTLPKESEHGLVVLRIWGQVASGLVDQNIVLAFFMSVYFYPISLSSPHTQTTEYMSKMLPKKMSIVFQGHLNSSQRCVHFLLLFYFWGLTKTYLITCNTEVHECDSFSIPSQVFH